MTRIYIVTPCFNAAETIDQTISSVLAQAGPFEIHYHIQDGGSSDDTVARLERWSAQLQSGDVKTFCKGIIFTFTSEPDEGMYDAIAKGFASFDLTDEDWLTWINADDMLAAGACSLMVKIDSSENLEKVDWVSGGISIVHDGAVFIHHERPLSAAIIREGLCEGRHWEFIQQEGTFFRGYLWNSLDVEADFAKFQLAGDWNLWRLFAQRAELYQVSQSLGLFHLREGQLSQSQRDVYFEEVDSIIPREDRFDGLVSLIGKTVRQKWLYGVYADRTLKAAERDLSLSVQKQIIDICGEDVARQIIAKAMDEANKPSEEKKALFVPGPRTDLVTHDADWQFPAVTEKTAFLNAKNALPFVKGLCYFAFPWASLLDQFRAGADRGRQLRDELKELSVIHRDYDRVVTVCQHVHMDQHISLLTDAGITDVFWSHATKDQAEISDAHGRTVRVHPFPLFPVQAVVIDRAEIHGDRKYLYSFIGARGNEWYLTQSRDWILDLLANDPRGFVAGRDSWHYQEIVYELQVRKRVDHAKGLVDDEASRVFRELLLSSTFSLCPSGSGPNSIRLWEAIGAGSIPVILADTYKLPGDIEVWNNAVVFCNETPEDIAALPDKLAEIAADPDLIASMRNHLDQLWMLYGPDAFVTDICNFYLEVGGELHASKETGPPLNAIAAQINSGHITAVGGLETFLKLCAGRVALNKPKFIAMLKQDRGLRNACAYSLTHCLEGKLTAGLSEAWREAGFEWPEGEAAYNQLAPVHRPRIHLFGGHSNRTPMSYPGYRRLFEKQVDYVDDIWKADTVITGFEIDYRSAVSDLSEKMKVRPELKLHVVSEEPLWDTVWSNVLTDTSATTGDNSSGLQYGVANHVNSDVFDFDKLPYFVTTDDRFFQRYGHHFQRNANFTVEEILSIWRRAPIRSAFYAEHRLDDKFDLFYPELGIRGLCSWRTRVAQSVQAGPIVRVGQGWNPNAPKRQGIPDWHLDKLCALDQRALIVSGLENTHHRDYITEKIFDAFAVLGVPLYYADPRHRIHEICPAGGFLNLYGYSEEDAAKLVDDFEPNAAFAKAYLETQKHLARLFSDPDLLNQERARVVSAVLGTL